VPPLFKKIKNAEFFAPFNFLILKEKNKCRNLKNVPPRPGRAGQHGGSVLSPSADLWGRLYRTVYQYLETMYG